MSAASKCAPRTLGRSPKCAPSPAAAPVLAPSASCRTSASTAARRQSAAMSAPENRSAVGGAEVVRVGAEGAQACRRRARRGGCALPPTPALPRARTRALRELCHVDVVRPLHTRAPLAEHLLALHPRRQSHADDTLEAARTQTLTDAASAFYATLDPITLDALVCDNAPLMDILAPEQRCTLGMRPGNLAAQPQTS